MNYTYAVCRKLSEWIARTAFHLQIHGQENIPQDGGVILAANHASFMDPPLVGICATRDVCFLARKTLMDVPVLGKLLPELNVIPVDRDGNDMSALKTVIRLIRAGNGAVVFPEGTRTRDGKLQPARAGLGLLVAKTLAPVVPIRIFGSFEAFPRSGGKIHLLPITLVVGKPMHFSKKDLQKGGREDYQRISEEVMDAIARLEIPAHH